MIFRRSCLGLIAGSALVSICLCSPLPTQVFYRAADGATYGPFPAESIEAWYREGYFPPDTPVAGSETGPFTPIEFCMHESSVDDAPTQILGDDEYEEPSLPGDLEQTPGEEEPLLPYSEEGYRFDQQDGVPDSPRRRKSLWR